MADFQKIEKSSGRIPNDRKFKRSNYRKTKLSTPGTGVEHEPSRIFFYLLVFDLFGIVELSLVCNFLSIVFARVLGLKVSWRNGLTDRVVWGKGPTAFSFIGDLRTIFSWFLHFFFEKCEKPSQDRHDGLSSSHSYV